MFWNLKIFIFHVFQWFCDGLIGASTPPQDLTPRTLRQVPMDLSRRLLGVFLIGEYLGLSTISILSIALLKTRVWHRQILIYGRFIKKSSLPRILKQVYSYIPVYILIFSSKVWKWAKKVYILIRKQNNIFQTSQSIIKRTYLNHSALKLKTAFHFSSYPVRC